MKRHIYLAICIFFIFCFTSFGSDRRLLGKVVDAQDGSPVAYADVILLSLDSGVVTHSSSGLDGSFALETSEAAELKLQVRMLGYEDFIGEPIKLLEGSNYIGEILLSRSQEGLEEVVVVGEKNQIVYKLDRERISSTASLTSSGGTVVDILSSTPSFMVDANGGVTFRGSSNFIVYVDGKLSPLEGSDALRQIPAARVEDVEIITTPSARYRTDGDGPIINITTKKAESDFVSGLLNLSGSSLLGWSADGTLNFRAGHNNFYLGGTAQRIIGRSEFNQTKVTTTYDSASKSLVENTSVSDGERWSDSETMIGRAGWQYSNGRKHNLTLELQAGKTDNWRGGDMLYNEVFNAHDRYDLAKDLFQASLDYVWRPTEKSEFVLSNRMRYDWYSIEYTESNLFDLSGNRYEGTRGYEEEHHWDSDGALSYKYNYSKDGYFELGYQYTTYSEHGGYRMNYWNRDIQAFQWQSNLATPFYYRRQVHSAYAMLSQTTDKFSFDAGLRADEVLDLMEIEIADASRNNKYFDIFPSAHISYNTGIAGIFGVGYSFRTNRPGIWNLEPYITYEDYYTRKIGNPDIRPEYAHSAEAGWRKSFRSGSSLAVTGYYRYRSDISDWVRSILEAGVTLDQIVNAGNQTEKGVEFNAVVKPVKWWTSTLGGNVFAFDFISKNDRCTDAEGWSYAATWNNAFNLAKKTRLQFDSHVVGPTILTQGKEDSFYYFNLALSQNLLKDSMTISLVGNDIFRTAKYSSFRHSPGLSSTTFVRPVYPNIVLSLSYNFNSSSHKSRSNASTELFEGRNF